MQPQVSSESPSHNLYDSRLLRLNDTFKTFVSNACYVPYFQRTSHSINTIRNNSCVCAAIQCAWLVGLGGLEPPASPLSGVRSNHLSYRPIMGSDRWWSLSGSNRRPPACKAGALPAELKPQRFVGARSTRHHNTGRSRVNLSINRNSECR